MEVAAFSVGESVKGSVTSVKESVEVSALAKTVVQYS